MARIKMFSVMRRFTAAPIKTDTDKSQNNPGGGVGARSSAVRRAISSKCQPTSSACVNDTPVTVDPIIVSPIVSAAAAAVTAAATAAITAELAVSEASDLLESITSLSNTLVESNDLFLSGAEYEEAASTASTTADRYNLVLDAISSAALVSENYNTIQAKADEILAFSETVTTNAQTAHDNYVIAKALQDSLSLGITN